MFWLDSYSPTQQMHRIRSCIDQSAAMTDAELQRTSLELRFRARSGTELNQLIPDAFALVREAASRRLGLSHYDVQLLGGLHATQGKIIEMETGQGKSLTALLPLYVYALAGKGAHLATSNDYLAQRDAASMKPVFEALGMSCGYVVDQMPDRERRQNYACDVTYGTGSEFGFDFLRDRTKRRSGGAENVVQRGQHFILADEADSLLIDDANMPMVLGTKGKLLDYQEALYKWIVTLAPLVKEREHFTVQEGQTRCELSAAGRAWVREQLRVSGPELGISIYELYCTLEKAILVHRHFRRDEQYLVRDGDIVLVNESTGRLGEGRQLQDGLHQLIQAAEGLTITAPNSHAARLTVQGFFLGYRHMAGMSGTAMSAADEFRKVYRLPVVRIPTAVPTRRLAMPTFVFPTSEQRWVAICDEIEGMRVLGRATLVGTRSVEKSELLGELLRMRGVPYRIVNARHPQEEAEAIAAAGQAGAVTVATGMAGRGTDIKLCNAVREAGGLHVILSELHNSIRSDQQMFGRCARQGDPGSYRMFLSAEDEILEEAYGVQPAHEMKARLQQASGSRTAILNAIVAAQRILENKQRSMRTVQFHYERRRLKAIRDMGLDPILDVLS